MESLERWESESESDNDNDFDDYGQDGRRTGTSINCNRSPAFPSNLAERFNKEISRSVESSPLQVFFNDSIVFIVCMNNRFFSKKKMHPFRRKQAQTLQ